MSLNSISSIIVISASGDGETVDEYIDVSMGRSILVDAIDATNAQINYEIKYIVEGYYKGAVTCLYEETTNVSGLDDGKTVHRIEVEEYDGARYVTECYWGKSNGKFYQMQKLDEEPWVVEEEYMLPITAGSAVCPISRVEIASGEDVQIVSAIKHTENRKVSYTIKSIEISSDSTWVFTIEDEKLCSVVISYGTKDQGNISTFTATYGTPDVVMPDVTPYLD